MMQNSKISYGSVATNEETPLVTPISHITLPSDIESLQFNTIQPIFKKFENRRNQFLLVAFLLFLGLIIALFNINFPLNSILENGDNTFPVEGMNMSDVVGETYSLSNGGWALPLSVNPPEHLNVLLIDRPDTSKPGQVLSQIRKHKTAIPTNSWCESLFIADGKNDYNRVFQIPYIVDVAGIIPGLRSHPARVMSDSREIMVTHIYVRHSCKMFKVRLC